MKTIKILAAVAVFTFASCEKESCKTCTITEYPSGISVSNTICGTDQENATANTNLKNECTQLKLENPNNTYVCGCK